MKQKQWKYVAIFLCSLVVALFATKTQARADSGDGWGSFGDSITWNYYSSTGTLEIKGAGDMPETAAPWKTYSANIKSVVIGEGITSVSKDLFRSGKMSSVKLPTTMRALGQSCFKDCKSLENIALPQGLMAMGGWCFYNTGLKSIDIPGTVEEIPQFCFQNCSNMEAVTFHEGTKVIEESAFRSTAIKELVLPASLYKLEHHAFSGVKSIEHLVLPSTITEVGDFAFSSCEGLRTLEVDITGKIPEGMFLHCHALEMVKIGENVTEITGTGNYIYGAFGYGKCAQSIYIPKSVKKIVKDAFFSPFEAPKTFYTYTGSAAWDYAGSYSYIDFEDLDASSNVAAWDAKWAAAMKPKKENTEDNAGNTAGGNTSGNNTVQKNPTDVPSLKTITTFSVTAKKGSKYIKVKTLKNCKIVVSMNKKIMKSGKKKVKKYTIKKSKTTNKINLSKKLQKNTKITVTVSKSGYVTRNRMLVVK